MQIPQRRQPGLRAEGSDHVAPFVRFRGADGGTAGARKLRRGGVDHVAVGVHVPDARLRVAARRERPRNFGRREDRRRVDGEVALAPFRNRRRTQVIWSPGSASRHFVDDCRLRRRFAFDQAGAADALQPVEAARWVVVFKGPRFFAGRREFFEHQAGIRVFLLQGRGDPGVPLFGQQLFRAAVSIFRDRFTGARTRRGVVLDRLKAIFGVDGSQFIDEFERPAAFGRLRAFSAARHPWGRGADHLFEPRLTAARVVNHRCRFLVGPRGDRFQLVFGCRRFGLVAEDRLRPVHSVGQDEVPSYVLDQGVFLQVFGRDIAAALLFEFGRNSFVGEEFHPVLFRIGGFDDPRFSFDGDGLSGNFCFMLFGDFRPRNA